MVHSEVAAYDSGRPGPLLGRPAMLASHMSALSQSQLISQMGIRSGIAHSSPSPPGSKSATPSPSSSTQEEESDAHFKVRKMEGCSYQVIFPSGEGALPGHSTMTLWKRLERRFSLSLETKSQRVDLWSEGWHLSPWDIRLWLLNLLETLSSRQYWP